MWMDLFEELLFKTINSKEATQKAAELKFENMPDIVYKYRTSSDNHINALEQNILYASAPSLLNDPYEGSLYIDFEKRWRFLYKEFLDLFHKKTGLRLAINVDDFDNRNAFILELAKCMGVYDHELGFWNKLWNVTDEVAKLGLQKFECDLKLSNEELHRICSFSSVYDSPPMWLHYSMDYSGFCVGYNIKELKNDYTDLLFPVRYLDDMLEVDDTFFNGGKPNDSFYIDSLTRKSSSWSYEHEWRLLLLADSDDKIQKVSLPTPKVVILGKNISKENQERIFNMTRLNKIPCYKQVLKKDGYSFQLAELI